MRKNKKQIKNKKEKKRVKKKINRKGIELHPLELGFIILGIISVVIIFKISNQILSPFTSSPIDKQLEVVAIENNDAQRIFIYDSDGKRWFNYYCAAGNYKKGSVGEYCANDRGDKWKQITIGDFDGDHKKEIAVTEDRTDRIYTYNFLIPGGWKQEMVINIDENWAKLTSGDLDGDGIDEIIGAENEGDTKRLWYHTLSGGEWGRDLLDGTSTIDWDFLLTADYDGDKIKELIVVNTDDIIDTYDFGTDFGGYTHKRSVYDKDWDYSHFAVGDLDNDGREEIIASKKVTDEMKTRTDLSKPLYLYNYENNWFGTQYEENKWFESQIYYLDTGAWEWGNLGTLQLDDDPQLEIYFTRRFVGSDYKSEELFFLDSKEGILNWIKIDPKIKLEGDIYKDIQTADWDNDGYDDIFTISNNPIQLNVIKNNGDGTFEDPICIAGDLNNNPDCKFGRDDKWDHLRVGDLI